MHSTEGHQICESGEPYDPERLLGIADWYRVHDWPRLVAALEKMDGVGGRREKGWVWLEEWPEGQRQVARLEEEGGRLVLEAATEAEADRLGSKLEEAVGPAVEFLIGQACCKPWPAGG